MDSSKTPTKPALKNIKFEPNGYCRICNTPTKGVLCDDKECRRKHLREWERARRYNKMVESIDATRLSHTGVEGIDYAECHICGFRHHRQITTHLIYHEISVDEYRSMYPNVAVIISAAGFRKGEANPAYGHGGKFSPWSDKFIHKTEGSVDAAKKKAKATVTANGNHNNTISFYMNKGMTEQQARQAVTERQTTFSKAKCVEKYGEEGGIARWEDRQTKWQSTLSSKPAHEIERIDRSKATKMNYRSLWKSELDAPGKLYVLILPNGWVKVGVTTRTLRQRYGSQLKDVQVVLDVDMCIDECFKVEQLCKRQFASYAIDKPQKQGVFGWTEVFNTPSDDVVDFINNLTSDTTRIHECFDREFRSAR